MDPAPAGQGPASSVPRLFLVTARAGKGCTGRCRPGGRAGGRKVRWTGRRCLMGAHGAASCRAMGAEGRPGGLGAPPPGCTATPRTGPDFPGLPRFSAVFLCFPRSSSATRKTRFSSLGKSLYIVVYAARCWALRWRFIPGTAMPPCWWRQVRPQLYLCLAGVPAHYCDVRLRLITKPAACTPCYAGVVTVFGMYPLRPVQLPRTIYSNEAHILSMFKPDCCGEG
jgi:hypothetical protein